MVCFTQCNFILPQTNTQSLNGSPQNFKIYFRNGMAILTKNQNYELVVRLIIRTTQLGPF